MRTVMFFAVAGATLAASAAAEATMIAHINRSVMTDVSGETVRRRPWVQSDSGGTLDLGNFKVHDIVDGKAFDVTISSPDKTPAGQAVWTYSNIYIHNIEAYNINRTPGVHNDFLMIDGPGMSSPRETNVTVEDAYFHDGNALTTLIHTGRYNTITLRRMQVENTTTSVQLGFDGDGYVKTVVIDSCPGLHVALFGSPGSIGTCIIRNSPGADISDVKTSTGKLSGVKIVYDNSAPASPILVGGSSVPEPGALSLLGLGAAAMLKRRRAA